MDDLVRNVRNTMLIYKISIVVITVLMVILLVHNLSLKRALTEMSLKRPITVVPGATYGIYQPGLTNENAIGLSRYLLSLVTNYTHNDVAGKLDFLQRFCAPSYCVAYEQAKLALVKEVTTFRQNRTFIVEGDAKGLLNERLKEIGDGTWQYEAIGPWIINTDTTPLSKKRTHFTLHFRFVNGYNENPYGAQILGIDKEDVAQ